MTNDITEAWDLGSLLALILRPRNPNFVKVEEAWVELSRKWKPPWLSIKQIYLKTKFSLSLNIFLMEQLKLPPEYILSCEFRF